MSQFGQSVIIDIPELANSKPEKWFNLDLTEVNECIVRLGVFEGEFHWHKHDKEDEFFFVISGRLILDLKSGTLELTPQQGYTVPKGTMHRTRAKERTMVLMMEKTGVRPKGD